MLLPPEVIVAGLADREAVTGFTVIVVLAVVVGLPPLLQATLYVVLAVGVTAMVPEGALPAPVENPVPMHIFPLEDHVSVLLCPLRIVAGLADREAVTADTITVALALTGVPPLSQAMLYVVLAVGLTT